MEAVVRKNTLLRILLFGQEGKFHFNEKPSANLHKKVVVTRSSLLVPENSHFSMNDENSLQNRFYLVSVAGMIRAHP